MSAQEKAARANIVEWTTVDNGGVVHFFIDISFELRAGKEYWSKDFPVKTSALSPYGDDAERSDFSSGIIGDVPLLQRECYGRAKRYGWGR